MVFINRIINGKVIPQNLSEKNLIKPSGFPLRVRLNITQSFLILTATVVAVFILPKFNLLYIEILYLIWYYGVKGVIWLLDYF